MKIFTKHVKTEQHALPDFTNETPEQTAIRNSANFKFSKYKAIMKVQKYFKFDKLGATFKKEVIGGVVTFLSLAYILSVAPNMMHDATSIADETKHMNIFGVFLATAIASFLGTFIMGLFANVPVAVSTGMGMIPMFVYNIANGGSQHLGYEGALIATMMASILFVIFSVTPIRTWIVVAIPKGIIVAIGISIGLFIAYIGMSDMGWLKVSGGVPSASLSTLKDNYPMILLGMFTLILILIFHFKKVPGGVAIAILIGLVPALIIANIVPDSNYLVSGNGALHVADLSQNSGWSYDFKGFSGNLSDTWNQFTNKDIWLNPNMYISIFVVLLMTFFDATGTLSAFNLQLNKYTNQHHDVPNKALKADSISTVTSSLLGASPTGAFVEAGAGIEAGARTGFAALTTSALFISAIVLFPIFNVIPQCISSAACIYIGIMMIGGISQVEWKKPEFAISTFFTMIFMIATYTIVTGMAMGFISYVVIMILTKKIKQVPVAMWPISILFILYFVAWAYIQ